MLSTDRDAALRPHPRGAPAARSGGETEGGSEGDDRAEAVGGSRYLTYPGRNTVWPGWIRSSRNVFSTPPAGRETSETLITAPDRELRTKTPQQANSRIPEP